MFDTIETAPESVGTTHRSLTQQIGMNDWRAVMDSIHAQSGGFRTPDRWNSVPVPERVALRAYTNVDKLDDGCWISRYSVASHGYAQIGWSVGNGKNAGVLAHRASWTHVNGQVPLGMTLDHTCKVRRCVNPEHLRTLPNYENARRTSGRDWPMGECANGHDSTHLKKSKRKANAQGFALICGTCERASKAKWEAANPDRKRLVSARGNWRKRHPGEPMPERLLLESEREKGMKP